MRCERVGDVVAIQVQCSDNAVFSWTQQDLLQERISDRILNDNVFTSFRILEFAPWAAVDQFCAKFFLCQCVCPVTEATFGVLHDVTFVNDRHRWFVIVDCVLDRFTYQTLCTFAGYWFYADTRRFWEADFFDAHFVLQEFDQFFHLIGTFCEFDTSVDVFRVFTEDHHVCFFWFAHWGWHAFEITDWTQANVQIEFLTQSNVQGTDTATNWCCQRTFDRNNVFFQYFQCFFWQPNVWAINFCGFFTCIDFHPADFTLASICFCNRSIHYLDHDRADIHTSSITLDKWDDWIVRNIQREISIDGNLFTFSRNLNMLIHRFLRSWMNKRIALFSNMPCVQTMPWAGLKSESPDSNPAFTLHI